MKNLNVKKVVILNEGDKIASRFCSDIRKINVLSRESEIEYFKVYQKTKCSKAREKIINANQKFVVSIARKYINSSNCHYLPDLINEGSIGLIEAIETFDVNRGYKFISYAVHYIRRSINEFLLTQVPIIKKPCLDVTAYIEPKIREKYMNTNGYEISNDEMLSEIQKIDNSVKNVYSLNVEYIDDDYNVHDTSNIESTFENEHNKLIAAELMNILLPFEKNVIELKMGFNDRIAVSLHTISIELKRCEYTIEKVYANGVHQRRFQIYYYHRQRLVP